ncbi:hypothetical protein RclHR1_10820006 [Rhizophagus clarus]|uniref:Reverse transcriptase domain-containing protein n=1 Tax=Rhizophagus clarus TaxID=94130 RepID=A0A2Z6Q2M8_9GLOM|nr:hypothetical protein RclHR1_10820006 [Rhizophagus clarus]
MVISDEVPPLLAELLPRNPCLKYSIYSDSIKWIATHNILKGGNFAGLPGGTCRNPIIILESIIHDTNHNNSPLWILSQDISKAFDSVNLTMLKFA